MADVVVREANLADARDALGVGSRHTVDASLYLRIAVESDRWIPLSLFITRPKAMEEPKGQRAARYGQAWALVAHLHRRRSEGFATYLRTLAARRTGEHFTTEREPNDFEAALGPLGPDRDLEFVKDMLSWPYDPKEAGR